MRASRLRTLSVCSGIGAPEAAGVFDPVGMCEIEAKPASVLRRHFPGVPIHEDLNDFRSWCETYVGVGCLIGGTPCQSFSVAGNMRGLDDERGNLMLSFLDLAEAVRPHYVVWENVPGVLTRKNRHAFDLLVGELERMGYCVEHEVLNAQHFGVPQHRKRVFVVASPDGIGLSDALDVREFSSVADILEESPDEKYNISAKAAAGVLRRREKFRSRPLPPVLRAALEDVAAGRELGAGELHLPTMSNGDDAVPTIRADATNYARCSGRSWNVDPMLIQPAIAPTLTARAHGVKDSSIHAKTTPPYLVTPAIAPTIPATGPGYSRTGHNAGDRALLVTPTLTKSANGFAKCGVEGRTTPPFLIMGEDGDNAATLTKINAGGHGLRGFGGNIVADSRRLRRFTPTECERLMGFPDGWTATDDQGREIKDTPRYQMLGNSMAVPVVGWIGRRLLERVS